MKLLSWSVFFIIFGVPKGISNGLSLSQTIHWNYGYSQFVSYVTDHKCLHLDPGGTLQINIKKILFYCERKKNSYISLHNDRFHTKYLSTLKKAFSKLEISKNYNAKLINNRKSKGYNFIILNQFYLTGHLDKIQIQTFLNSDSQNLVKYVVLPNHGQPIYLNQENLEKFRGYKMIITGSQSRKYLNHQITENKFLKKQIPIVFKNKWGHLVFQN